MKGASAHKTTDFFPSAIPKGNTEHQRGLWLRDRKETGPLLGFYRTIILSYLGFATVVEVGRVQSPPQRFQT